MSLDVAVIQTVHNTGFKAAAINGAITPLVRRMFPFDHVLLVDGDSYLVPEWIEAALAVDAPSVGGIFRGQHPTNLLGQLQCNEYARYARQVSRRGGRAYVLTGTATMSRVSVLQQLVDERGFIYSEASRTEDNEFTLAVRTLGYVPMSPKGCVVCTEPVPSLRGLWRQRTRWYRGAVEDLGRYGLTRVTAPYIARMAMLYVSVIVLLLYLGFVLPMGLGFSPLWVGVGVVFVVERTLTVWKEGWRGTLVAATLVIEMLYVLFLDAALLLIFLRRKSKW